MKRTTILGLVMLCSSLFTQTALGWGQTGHRVTGEFAQTYLSDDAKKAIAEIIGVEDLAEASTFADEMRSNPSLFWQKTANPWHYVNIPAKGKYTKAPPEGDAVSALKQFTKTLMNDKASLEDRQIALRFIVHIIGDVHQPFHSGTTEDRGGNRIRVKFFRQDSNIHRVWDSGLIDRQKLSYTEWAQRLTRKTTDADLKAWSQTDPQVWIAESAKIRMGLYPEDENLSWDYQYMSMPIVNARLHKAGIRIAAYFNELYAK